MSLICYHASHEQFAPSHLLKLAVAAERAGFGGLHSSDHFHPWSERQGHSGFSFAWVAAALQATSLPQSMVCAPGQRYHPAIVAQAIATLGEMFPGRYSVELGSGEAMNEAITGHVWPDKAKRNERLAQCAQVIRQLLAGEEVNCEGHVRVCQAKLYTLPETRPLLLGAAVTAETAGWIASWADGLLITADKEMAETRRKIEAFKAAGGGERPIRAQYSFSYARDWQVAIDEAWDQWKVHVAACGRWADIATVAEFDECARDTTREHVIEQVPIFTSMEKLKESIDELRAMGVERIILHNVNRRQEEFIEDYRRIA